MEFKDVTILDKTDALFSTQYSDPVDLLSQHLQNKFTRIQRIKKRLKNKILLGAYTAIGCPNYIVYKV